MATLLRHRRDRHQPQRRPRNRQEADRAAAVVAGCDAVKFQKRTPELCVPPAAADADARDALGRDDATSSTGTASSSAYDEYAEIDHVVQEPRRHLVRLVLGRAVGRLHRAVRARLLQDSVGLSDRRRSAHARAPRPAGRSSSRPACRRWTRSGTPSRCSTRSACCSPRAPARYPCPPEELNLRVIQHAADAVRLPGRILRARERTADDVRRGRARRLPSSSGTSRSTARCGAPTRRRPSSRGGLIRLVRDIRTIERALGDGVKRLYSSELSARQKLRRITALSNRVPRIAILVPMGWSVRNVLHSGVLALLCSAGVEAHLICPPDVSRDDRRSLRRSSPPAARTDGIRGAAGRRWSMKCLPTPFTG